MTGLAHRRVAVAGVRLHVAEAGQGPPVLLLPGWPQSWLAWRHVVPLLVAAGRRVVVLDPRGLGDSDRPEGGYDLDTVAGEIHGFLAQEGLLGLDIVSHDVGSWIAYALAAGHPAAVHRLVLSEMTMQTAGVARPVPDEAANIAGWHFGFNRLHGLPEALVAGRERLFLDWMFDNKAARPAAIDEAARAHYEGCFARPGAARAGFDYYRALLSPAGLARMAERLAVPLPMPVLAIGAEGGVRGRLADSLQGAAPRLSSLVLPGGHYLPEEAPEAFAAAVLAFWRDTVDA
ncbi:alpha/beta fold hydrolase [Roseomonas sp. 18066]|uniref:alpha/beta fold hydrolase n=1 Tax=Roseomonas sp. 18066 TaxID=2681412 RepID=UPI00135CF365|nr:alpha/beta fold hydrolase [Roseomonas sp. 18066]